MVLLELPPLRGAAEPEPPTGLVARSGPTLSLNPKQERNSVMNIPMHDDWARRIIPQVHTDPLTHQVTWVS